MADQKTRRGNGEGCITQRKDGRWQGYITLSNGKRKSVSRTKRREVAEELKRLQSDDRQGKCLDADRITIAVYLDRWLKESERRNLKPTTIQKQKGIIETHLKPRIGHVRLQKLNADHINDLMDDMRDDPKKPASVYVRHDTHKVLSSALKKAEEEGRILSNPAKRTKRPSLPQREGTTLTQEQLGRFCQHVKGDEYEAAFVLAALSGMRQGEVLGLQWDDIDFNAGTVSINRTLAQIGRKEMRAYQPKTKASRRTIRPHGLAMKTLKEHQKRMEERFPESAWVFVWKDGGPVPRRNFLRIFKELLRDANCPDVRFHDLRHSAGTILMAAGENPKVVSSLLGHSNVSITLGLYSHASEDLTAKAADTLGAIVEAETKKTVAER